MPTYQIINGQFIDIWASEEVKAHARGVHIYAPEEETYGVQWSNLAATTPEQAEATYLHSCACLMRLSGTPDAKRSYALAMRRRRFPVKKICC